METVKEAYTQPDREYDRVTAHEVRALSASGVYNCQVALTDILSAAFWRSSWVFQNSYLRDMACIADGMSTLGPVVVAQHIVDPGHLHPPPLPTRSVCSDCYDVLNEDYLIISWCLHVWNGVAVAGNPPACPAEKRSLGENLVTDRQMPCSAHVRLCTEAGMWLNFDCLGSAGEPNICSHCYAVPYMMVPANNQVIMFIHMYLYTS